MTEMPELKPCPFCGNDGSDHSINVCHSSTIRVGWEYTVECTGCGADGPYSATPDRAADTWNRRATTPSEDYAAGVRGMEPLAEAMQDLLHEGMGVVPDSASAFYDYQKGLFTTDRIRAALLPADQPAPAMDVREAARVLYAAMSEEDDGPCDDAIECGAKAGGSFAWKFMAVLSALAKDPT